MINPIEYKEEIYRSIEGISIPTVGTTRSFVGRLSLTDQSPKIPSLAKRELGDLLLFSYRGANLIPSVAAYKHAVKAAEVIREMADDEKKPKPIVVVDVGTGSGVIAITIARQLRREVMEKTVKLIGTDICGRALAVADINAQFNEVEGVNLRKRNVLQGLVAEFGKLDVIISNPPYFPSNTINPRYKRVDFVPMLAVDGGIDGMDMYRSLFSQANSSLSDNGFILVQHMTYQQRQVSNLAQLYLPGRSTLAVNGSGCSRRSDATAIGCHDILQSIQSLSGGHFLR